MRGSRHRPTRRRSWRLICPPMRFIPRKAKTAVPVAAAPAFTAPERARWWMILAFGKLVLSRRAGHVRVMMEDPIRRAKPFSKFDFCTLIAEARAESARNNGAAEKSRAAKTFEKGADAPRHTQHPDLDECCPYAGNVDKCIRLARQAQISRATAAMSPSPRRGSHHAVLDELRDKHPKAEDGGISPALRQKLLNLAAPRTVDAEEVIKILRTFPPGSAAGS